MFTLVFYIQFCIVGELALSKTDSMHAFYYASAYSSGMYSNPFLIPSATHSYHQTYIR